jgi:hypothetical protein
MQKFVKYGATLIAIYLAVAYASGTGRVISTGATGSANIIKAFQGR